MAPRLGFRRLFVANRGEVAVRVARTCEALGIAPVLAVSAADAKASYVRGREHVCIGPARAADSYLDPVRVVEAARQSACSALHPGWGFLSERPILPALCRQHGIAFVGPSPEVMALMGSKTPAKRAMAAAGLALIPGSDGPLASAAEARAVAEAVGYPVLLKAESGGGGKGMRIVRAPERIEAAFEDATAEARAAFSDPRVYLERLVEGGRHVEIQILADKYGNVVHLGERDCTVQRNHQKLIEESPCPVLSDEERARTLAAAARAAASIGYEGAGTLEFLLDADGTLRFMEMNTRLQVEHCVTEMRTGLDLVAEQIRIAAGAPLAFGQDDVRLSGHALECRINAEDPLDDFRPSPGRITRFRPPEGEGIRVDTHVAEGDVVPPHYDSLIAKLVVWGPTREAAIERALAALDAFEIEGVATTIPLHRAVLASEAFRTNAYDTRTIPGWPPEEAS